MNVFAEGKPRVKRQRLEELASNPNQPAKFLNHRKQNMLAARSRNRAENHAPQVLPKSLISLDSKSPGYLQPHSTSGAIAVATTSSSMLSDKAIAGNKAKRIKKLANFKPTFVGADTQMPDAPRSGKRPVRFDAEQEKSEVDTAYRQHPTPGITNTSSPTTADLSGNPGFFTSTREPNGWQGTPRFDERPAAARRKMSLSEYHRRKKTGILTKRCSVSPADRNAVRLSFHAPLLEGWNWPESFIECEELQFGHLCLAQLFLRSFRRAEPVSESSATAAVTCAESSQLTGNIANGLRPGAFGLICLHQDFGCLIYPSKCDDWRELSPSCQGEPLQFCFFEPGCESLLKSVKPLLGQSISSLQLSSMRRCLVVDKSYANLIPEDWLRDPQQKRHIFLAFPQSADREESMLSEWLSQSDPSCLIKTSQCDGHWSAFLNYESGLVIFHETVAFAPGSKPLLWSLLRRPSCNFSFWSYSSSLPGEAPDLSRESDSFWPVHASLDPILVQGRVFLMTPSFIVSQPWNASLFCQWYFASHVEHKGGFPNEKIVIAPGLRRWLGNLMGAKTSGGADAVDQFVDGQMLEGDASRQQDALLSIYGTLLDIIHAEEDEVTKTEGEYIVPAPNMIDPNDEQSLVNWFGGWSMMNMHRFREFIVLGSSQTDSERLCSRIIAPRFAASVTDTVDEAYDEGCEAIAEGQLLPSPSATDSDAFATDRSVERICLVISDRVQEAKKSPLILAEQPVSCWQDETALGSVDSRSKFMTHSAFKDGIRTSPKMKNMMAALFFTRDGPCEGYSTASAPELERHLWLAIFRPIDWRKRSWERSELLIWDPRASTAYPQGSDINEDELARSSIQLIRLMREVSSEAEDRPIPLERVWISGPGGSEPCRSDHLRLAAQFLETVIKDPDQLIPEEFHKLKKKGWRLVNPEPSYGTEPMQVLSPLSRTQLADSEGEVEREQAGCIVMRPPRSTRRPEARREPSKCRNHLFHCVKREEPKLGPDREMSYLFQRTLSWYNHQVNEGRGLDHLNIKDWDKIFADYDIGDHERYSSEGLD